MEKTSGTVKIKHDESNKLNSAPLLKIIFLPDRQNKLHKIRPSSHRIGGFRTQRVRRRQKIAGINRINGFDILAGQEVVFPYNISKVKLKILY